MTAYWRSIVALATLAAAAALAGEGDGSGRRAASPEKPAWEFGLTAYPTSVRGGDNYVSGIAVADRGPLHLEARRNYEAIGATSAFVGWTFSGGEKVEWALTPLLGGVWGTTHAIVPGVEASLTWGRFDYYIEAEYVRDRNAQITSYTYVWSEIGFKAFEWLRIGTAAQRTSVYAGDREFQRGPFVQASWRRAKIGAYWFNPGSNDQVVIGSIGVTF